MRDKYEKKYDEKYDDTRKKAKEAKNYTQEWRELKCAYTKKNDLSLELNKGLQLWFLKTC